MIRDWNRSQVLGQAVFHFKNSLRPFVSITVSNEDIFLDIDSMEGYTLDELEYEGLEFYEKDDDEDFKGVDVDGTLKSWFR